MKKNALQSLPAVETVLQQPALAGALQALPRPVVVEAVREAIDEARARLRANGAGSGPDAAALAELAARAARRAARPALERVLNATGIVLHTNLGRAPYAAAARAAIASVGAGYSSLEVDLDTGRRGQRGAGVERWLTRLTGAEGAVVVNNGAGAVLLALSAIASGRGVLVSRGELVEIGGSFRVPEVMEKSGARLIEVGATNRTHLRDYEKAFEKHDDVAAILRVHRSNFRMEGFTKQPEIAELAALAARYSGAHLNQRRQRTMPASQGGEHRAHVWPLGSGFGRLRRRLPGEEKMSGGGVIGIGMGHGADQAQLISTLSELRKVLADFDARYVSANGPKLAPDFRRSIGLHIPRFQLRRPAPHEQKNASLGLAERSAGERSGTRGSRLQQLRQCDAQQAETAEAQQFPPRELAAKVAAGGR
jgi:hypothetical protein